MSKQPSGAVLEALSEVKVSLLQFSTGDAIRVVLYSVMVEF